MKPNPLWVQIFGATLSILLFTSLLFVGCGAFEDDNSQPSIETITDKTLNAGDETTVKVTITDADVDDTHIINASSDDTNIATVSVDENSLTITGNGVGRAMITVSATDKSGQDSAAAVPVTFEVTVEEPLPSVQIGIGINQPPSSFINKGPCTVGMTLKPGEGCSYDDDSLAELIFFVREDGTACREQVPKVIEGIEIPEDFRPRKLKFCVEWDIERDDTFETSFAASKKPDGSWTVRNVP
jgi:hypothetical protein